MENDSHVNEPAATYGQPLDFQQIMLLFKETDRQFKETDRQFKETDKKLKESESYLTEKFKETDRILTEKFKETDNQINKLSALFTSQWGKFVESLVEGDLVKLLKLRDIKVEQTLQRVKGNRDGENYEFDIIAVNTNEIVIVEVKTTLRPQDVKDFHRKLWKAKQFMPLYANMTIYGAMAYITADGASQRMAENLGLFVIRATGSSSSIVNNDEFKPKAF